MNGGCLLSTYPFAKVEITTYTVIRSKHELLINKNTMSNKLENELISVKMKRGTNQKVKVLASMDKVSIQDWFDWMVDKAYEATIKNHQASARSKKAMSV